MACDGFRRCAGMNRCRMVAAPGEGGQLWSTWVTAWLAKRGLAALGGGPGETPAEKLGGGGCAIVREYRGDGWT